MKVEELTPEFKIFDFNHLSTDIKWYRYLCVHPHNKEYHILIDKNEEPVRMYGKNLQKILDKDLKSYDEALDACIKELQTMTIHRFEN